MSDGMNINITTGNADEQAKSVGADIKNESPQLNTVFDVDKLGNNDGKIEEADFNLAYKKNPTLKEKLENLYIEFASEKLGKAKTVGNYQVTVVDLPFSPTGVTERRKIMKDTATGKVVMKSNTTITEKDGLTTVKVYKERFGIKDVKINDSEFQYNKELLEKYIIEDAVDSHGKKIKYFSSIPDIKSIPEEARTSEQNKLLEEFDNLVKYSIEAGTDYGIDPKLVISIIQQEVAFQGLSDKVVGKNGKGYMQLTSAPVQDFLGYLGGQKYSATKISLYGPEMEELLLSRGFDTQKAKSSFQKMSLYQDIMDYLKTNKDAEFNIRLGSQVLGYYMNRANGNVKIAAKNYNGSPLKEQYSRNVTNYHQVLEDTVPKDSTYAFKKEMIRFPKR